MKFSELVTELKADIWPEGVPESLTAPIGRNFEAAVTHLQRYVPCLQSRNINRYPQCSTYFQGGKTVIDAPKGRINRVYTILDTAGEEVYPAVFRQVTKDELECNNLKLLSLVYPPKNLEDEPLPMGFKYPESDSDHKVNNKGEKLASKHGRAVIGQWAIDRDRIYISPWINSIWMRDSIHWYWSPWSRMATPSEVSFFAPAGWALLKTGPGSFWSGWPIRSPGGGERTVV